jgi:hypothetical protein
MIGTVTFEVGAAIASGGLGKGAKAACFLPGTLVEARNGLLPIEELKPGDLVLSRDEVTGLTGWKPVLRTFQRTAQEIVYLGLETTPGSSDVLGVTPDHPFWVSTGNWSQARDLREGDLVLTSILRWSKVTSSSMVREDRQVYNLEIADYHTYFVGNLGAWVHNACRVRKAAPHPDARGPHSTLKRGANGKTTGYTTFDGDGNIVKRVRMEGGPHGGVEPPLVLEPKPGKGPGSPANRARPARPEEIPGGGQ